MTEGGYQKLKQELHRLKTVERPQNVKEIETAIAHGDLSENAEYHAAKEKQSHIAGRIDQVEDRIARAQVIDPSGQEPDRVRFGATVLLEDSESGEEVTYRIVGEDESDAAQGLISVTSPVARALMNKEPDAEVKVRVPKGTRTFEILEIRYE
jgi:transcription elongation factor GreA